MNNQVLHNVTLDCRLLFALVVNKTRNGYNGRIMSSMYCWCYLHHVDQYPVKHEPDQDMDHVEGDGVDPEEDVGREGGEGPRQHALGERLQQDGVGQHGRAQLDPAEHK